MHKVYIELTSKCGLACDFCPSSSRAFSNMEIALFEKINKEVKVYTNDIAYHVVGDPLLVENLTEYLDISHSVGLHVHITTTGYYLKPHHTQELSHPAIKQINFSLNSYRGNSLPISLEEYLHKITSFTLAFRQLNSKAFINYRLWNKQEDNTHVTYNEEVINIVAKQLMVSRGSMQKRNKNSLRAMYKVLFNFDSLFEWPSLDAPYVGDTGRCHGLTGQMAILSSGALVPCCFDYEAIINLGNLKNETIATILNKERSKALIEGFASNKITEELCKHCSYKKIF